MDIDYKLNQLQLTEAEKIEEQINNPIPQNNELNRVKFIPCVYIYYSSNILLSETFGIVTSKRLQEPLKDFQQCPGGKINFDESPKQCAQRETLEETGLFLEANRIRYLNTYQYGPSPFGPDKILTKRIVYTFYTIITQEECKNIGNPEPEKSTDWYEQSLTANDFYKRSQNTMIDSLRDGIKDLPYVAIDYRMEFYTTTEQIYYLWHAGGFIHDVYKKLNRREYGLILHKEKFEDLISAYTLEADDLESLRTINEKYPIPENSPFFDNLVAEEFRWQPYSRYYHC